MQVETLFRIIFVGVILSAFMISGYFRRKAKQSGETISRRAEGSAALFLRMGLAMLFFGSIALHVISPSLMDWASLELPIWLRWAGAALALLCVPLLWWVFTSIGDNISETVLTKVDHQLVTEGPYRWVRHPLYTVALLMFFSLGLMAASWLIMLYSAAGVAIFRWVVIPKEELRLVQTFGQDYQAYQSQTGAMLPRLSP
jgi:protein-S-isoprenylcysteine O-methyltransferase Ste14